MEMDYESVCKYVGQLYLESRHEIQKVLRQAAAKIEKAEKERDEALSLLKKNGKS